MSEENIPLLTIFCYWVCCFTRFLLSKALRFCLVFSGAVGLSFMQFTNMNSMRNLFIIGISLFLGISIPEYFFQFTISAQHSPAHTRAGWVCSLSPLAVTTFESAKND